VKLGDSGHEAEAQTVTGRRATAFRPIEAAGQPRQVCPLDPGAIVLYCQAYPARIVFFQPKLDACPAWGVAQRILNGPAASFGVRRRSLLVGMDRWLAAQAGAQTAVCASAGIA
jgi:hypothetical protein